MVGLARRCFGVPRAVLEPTCGVGGLLVAAHAEFGPGVALRGVEIDGDHAARARANLTVAGSTRHRIDHDDFFRVDWSAVLADVPAPTLVVGNPPWVTNAELGRLEGRNLPPKANPAGWSGLDGLTGRSNFDISEWMVRHLMGALAGRDAALAVLMKESVARRLLEHAWAHDWPLREPCLWTIDARVHFGASVSACVLTARTDRAGPRRCPVFASLHEPQPARVIGHGPGVGLLADLDAHRDTAHLAAPDDHQPPWRSGIKHDCARVLELREQDGRRVNGFGEPVDVEEDVLYPLLKSSDLAAGRDHGGRWLLVTQRELGEDPARLAETAPRAWAYLCAHADRLDARRSSIYRSRPRFCMFGVGAYAFGPWKVAISGLYKQLSFRCIGPHASGRPVVLDDTAYLLPCASEAEARRVHAGLMSESAQRFFCALVFWDAKRPITAGLLRRLDLRRVG